MISNETLSILATAGTTIGVIGAMIGAFPFLKKKGVDTDNMLNTTDKALTAVGPVLDTLEELLPNNPAINLVDFIDNKAVKAVKVAEQLNNSGQLSADDRYKTAQDSVYAALKEMNIAPTENQQKIINDAIQAAVYDLPHTAPDVKQLQTTIDQQNAQNAQLQNENGQLKQTIATITQAVQSNTSTNTETPVSTEQTVNTGVTG